MLDSLWGMKIKGKIQINEYWKSSILWKSLRHGTFSDFTSQWKINYSHYSFQSLFSYFPINFSVLHLLNKKYNKLYLFIDFKFIILVPFFFSWKMSDIGGARPQIKDDLVLNYFLISFVNFGILEVTRIRLHNILRFKQKSGEGV